MSEENKSIQCSFCSSENVKKISSFGTAQLVRQYYCNGCRSVFEYVRWQDSKVNG
ncbi:PaaD-like zinc ribbon domain-containing protein [Bacillus sp. V33-4]|uniref:PaaD-like zinc ribbon domain-containing protein n=1 Tax=Bacillus sp. V33-4 TaxID=2054169 RepID=UPI003F8D780C